jgi:ABC-type transport system involved in Fe-S cluster assembly fused permease/ATPase subunit
VSGILFVNFGPKYAIVAAATVGTYTVFTVKVSNWRSKINPFLIYI